ncbi:MAG: hypothetical protein ACK5MA_07850 [Parachlamydiaceae bacterium]
MSLHILSKPFFSKYIIHPRSNDLNRHDRKKALIVSIAIGVFTLGFCHLICSLAFRNKRVSLQEDAAAKETNAISQRIFDKTQKEEDWTVEEILQNGDLNGDELYFLASNLRPSPDDQFRILRKASDLDYPPAMAAVGKRLCDEGNEHDGMLLLNRAADAGELEACQDLIQILSEKRHLTTEEKDSIEERAGTLFDSGKVVFILENSNIKKFEDMEAILDHFKVGEESSES